MWLKSQGFSTNFVSCIALGNSNNAMQSIVITNFVSLEAWEMWLVMLEYKSQGFSTNFVSCIAVGNSNKAENIIANIVSLEAWEMQARESQGFLYTYKSTISHFKTLLFNNRDPLPNVRLLVLLLCVQLGVVSFQGWICRVIMHALCLGQEFRGGPSLQGFRLEGVHSRIQGLPHFRGLD